MWSLKLFLKHALFYHITNLNTLLILPTISLIFRNDNSQEDEQLEANKAANSKTGGKRGIMQLNRFGWIDILDARSKSKDEPVKPCIYTTKFR